MKVPRHVKVAEFHHAVFVDQTPLVINALTNISLIPLRKFVRNQRRRLTLCVHLTITQRIVKMLNSLMLQFSNAKVALEDVMFAQMKRLVKFVKLTLIFHKLVNKKSHSYKSLKIQL